MRRALWPGLLPALFHAIIAKKAMRGAPRPEDDERRPDAGQEAIHKALRDGGMLDADHRLTPKGLEHALKLEKSQAGF